MKEILITSSALILGLVLLRRVLRGHITPRLQYALWLLVAVRLLVPVQLGSSSLSAVTLLGRAEATPAVQALQTVGDLTLPDRSYEDAYAQAAEDYAARDPGMGELTESARLALEEQAYGRMKGPTLSELAETYLPRLWLTGAAIMALWFLWVNLRFRRQALRAARLLEGTDSPLPVFVSDTVPSPCLLGLFRPAVCLTPACAADPPPYPPCTGP